MTDGQWKGRVLPHLRKLAEAGAVMPPVKTLAPQLGAPPVELHRFLGVLQDSGDIEMLRSFKYSHGRAVRFPDGVRTP